MSVDHLDKVESAQQALLKKTHSGKVGAQFVQEVKESLLFQYNWNEVLYATPTAITLMGAYHVAAASPEASTINLGDGVPTGGFKHLRFVYPHEYPDMPPAPILTSLVLLETPPSRPAWSMLPTRATGHFGLREAICRVSLKHLLNSLKQSLALSGPFKVFQRRNA